MPGLHRIILINCHLPGFVELDVSGHSNICGTNASGKTTLQRLIPVFYGELPSKVVPKTRKKFDEFYLPHANSYLIYEYEREEGQICQVVLTRKGADGVQYRLVEAAYHQEQLLVDTEDGNVQAMLPEQWIKQLRQLGIEFSYKIQATSEFRSIIQNDANVGRGNNRDNTKLRQLASRFSLVSSQHRIRHMEKLVSAVHAKEGKMDTLRTMLAAIFEEDGLVQPTTTVKNTKAREWITQMRQTMRLQSMQGEFQKIQGQTDALNAIENQLLQLKPELEKDLRTLVTQKADGQQKRNALKGDQAEAKDKFESQEGALNSQLSETTETLNAKSSRLDHIQNQYEKYQDSDLDQLQKDTESLPLKREEYEQKLEQYNLLIEQHQDLQRQLEQQKFKLAESLERLSRKNQTKVKTISAQKEQVRLTQSDKETELRGQFEQRKEQQGQEFEVLLLEIERSLVRQEHQAEQAVPTPQELENGALADKRLELAQRAWQQCSSAKNQAENNLQALRAKREEADKLLHSARQATRLAKDQLQQLHKQLSPEQDSLRQFLREHKPGWEHNIGKVIDASLLDRKDLAPKVTEDESEHILGLSVDLAIIEAPDYAQDETALSISLELAKNHLAAAEKQQKLAEADLDQCHQEAELQREALAEQNRAFEQAEQELTYAQSAKQRFTDELKHALDERRKQAKQALQSLLDDKQQVLAQKQQAFEVLKSDFEEQLLEFKSGWQDELAVLDEQIDELESQVEDKRQQNREQIKQLEDAFNQELSNKDIDPNTLKQLKQQTESLKNHIQNVTARRDELNEYKTFIQSDWLKQRPELLEQEAELKSAKQALEQQQHLLRQQYKTKRSELSQALSEVEKGVANCASLVSEIEPMVKQLALITFSFQTDETQSINLGDQAERINRCTEALESRSRGEKKLKEALTEFESDLGKDAGKDFLDTMLQAFSVLEEEANVRDRLPILQRLLSILESRQRQIVEQGETIGGDLNKFFTVFSDINRKIAQQSKRLTDEVSDDLSLDGIARSEVKIISTVDELNFWQPLKRFAQKYDKWQKSQDFLPSDGYLDSLADVVEVLPNDANYSIESLLRLELHLNEGGSDLVIKNDRQLLESSSHGMAYLILCKFLLAFTRLLRNQAEIDIHWPIDEIGTLAYHNVEKLFHACDANKIHILGAFPNPESDVLMLFKHRYLIDKQKQRLEKIEPKLSRIAERLQQNNSTLNNNQELSA